MFIAKYQTPANPHPTELLSVRFPKSFHMRGRYMFIYQPINTSNSATIGYPESEIRDTACHPSSSSSPLAYEVKWSYLVVASIHPCTHDSPDQSIIILMLLTFDLWTLPPGWMGSRGERFSFAQQEPTNHAPWWASGESLSKDLSDLCRQACTEAAAPEHLDRWFISPEVNASEWEVPSKYPEHLPSKF